MNRLKDYLADSNCCGVVRSASGEIVMFRRRGVIDLFELSTENPAFLRGATAADKVVGRGAALLFVRGGIDSLYAGVISSGALEVLCLGNVRVEYGTLVPHIINRAGTGICPVERLTSSTDSPEEAYLLIKHFIENQKHQK